MKILKFVFCGLILFLCVTINGWAQEKQKFNPSEFFTGKWAGEIEGTVQGCLPCWYGTKHEHPKELPWHPFRIELIGKSADAGNTDLKIQAKYPPLTFQAKGMVGFIPPDRMVVQTDVGDPISIPHEALGFVATLFNGGFTITEVSDKSVKLIFGTISEIKDMKATMELYRIELLKKTFPKDIKPNEPIKTDKKTQLEITMPSKDVIKVAQNSEAVIRSESLMEIMKGRIHGFIKKFKPKTKFEIHTPIATTGVRGTEFELNIEDDGTTTVVVLEGEVEFSDKENKKTVIVKKNQQSVVKPMELPSEPVQINPDQILKWYE